MPPKAPKDARQVFSPRAQVYAQGRPAYAPEFSVWLKSHLSRATIGADIGSGTGIFTRELLAMRKRIYAVEPNPDMRAQAEAALAQDPHFLSVSASGEATTLPGRSVDFVTAASSFHWLDTEAFRKECLRILRPQGEVFVLFHEREVTDPLSLEQDAICRTYCPRYRSLAHGWAEAMAAFPDFYGEELQFLTFPCPLPYSREIFVARSLSSSYSLAPGDAHYDAYRKALEDLAARFADDRGQLLLPNATKVAYGRPKE